MNLNQDLLRQIGVSHPKNDQVISAALGFGAIGAKLVGAGGGGYCLALMKNEADAADLIEGLKDTYSCFFANVIS
jgi:mevalonate kinase